MFLIRVAGYGLPSNISIVISRDKSERLDSELGQRRVHIDGYCFDCYVVLGFRCVRFELSDIGSQSLQSGLELITLHFPLIFILNLGGGKYIERDICSAVI